MVLVFINFLFVCFCLLQIGHSFQNLTLIFSTLVTNERFKNAKNTFNRFDTFLVTLKSFSKIRFKKIFLLIQLQEQFKHRQNEITELVEKNFKKEIVFLKFQRYTFQNEWTDLIKEVIDDGKLLYPFNKIN